MECIYRCSHFADEQTKDAGSINDLVNITLLGDLRFVARTFAPFPNRVSGKEREAKGEMTLKPIKPSGFKLQTELFLFLNKFDFWSCDHGQLGSWALQLISNYVLKIQAREAYNIS